MGFYINNFRLMKEDILEQLVEDYFVDSKGFFVKHNIRFRPDREHEDYISNRDSVHSDIDILALNATAKEGPERVHVATCKSWQGGFDPKKWRAEIEKEAEYNERSDRFKPRERWKSFRELVSDKWMKAFLEKIEEETGQRDFTYTIAVTKLNGTKEERRALEESEILKARFKNRESNVIIKFLTLSDIIERYGERMEVKDTPSSLEATDVGRLLQLIHSAGLRIKKEEAK